jgi:hypothetical protein
MANLIIPNSLWKRLTDEANRQRQKPETLAERALRGYLGRLADERLMADTARAARQAPFPIGATEDVFVSTGAPKRKG